MFALLLAEVARRAPFLPELLHPLRYWGYEFWSGLGSDLGEVTLVTLVAGGIATFWTKHNCHEHRCLRLSWHPDEEGHPVCKKHHPDHPSHGLWWAIKHFIRTGHAGDHDHPRHRRNPTKDCEQHE